MNPSLHPTPSQYTYAHTLTHRHTVCAPSHTPPAQAVWGALWFGVIDDADWEADHLGASLYQGRKSQQPALMIFPSSVWQNPQ